MTSLQELLVAHAAAVKAGQNIEELAASLEMKVESLNQRLNSIRKSLREAGATDAEIALAVPKLIRRTSTRTTSNKPILTDLLAGVRAAAAAEAEAAAAAEAEAAAAAEAEAEAAAEAELNEANSELELVG